MKWGIIGTGNMGQILIHAWMSSGVIEPDQLYINNRTISKAQAIQTVYPGVHVLEDKNELAAVADILFICARPTEIYPLLAEIHDRLTSEQCLVSITSPYSVQRLEQLVPCQVVRMIPSITNRALSGTTLFSFGESVTKEMKGYLLQSSKLFSKPQAIEEKVTRIASDIVSCGPAFFSYLAQEFIEAACRDTSISKQEATSLMENMLIGYGKLLEEGHYSLPRLVEKVCVKGGVTGEGIKALEGEAGRLFSGLISRTHAKYREDIEKISYQMLEG
ncbi:late competence protein ComER [Sediminibacillus dalangtanensis]|uniref:Late competence protein ComER n=1 Tax=Sediminibacillus dalangtanensis TaxID=2729421 RepID=A0ABX7VSH1_9BACI|nr:late competence protein ComER [Sediminibacillus dalangtanensis]QTM99891.1 late competence protein ComER [Sediminibacillus dalangtanensis]